MTVRTAQICGGNSASDSAFLFVVKRLRWLAKIPLFPQFFDAALTAWAALAKPERLAAIDELETAMRARPGVRVTMHRFGGTEFVLHGEELGHVHGHGLLDVRLPHADAESLVASGIVRRHHIFPPASGWVSFQLHSREDISRALELLNLAKARLDYPSHAGGNRSVDSASRTCYPERSEGSREPRQA